MRGRCFVAIMCLFSLLCSCGKDVYNGEIPDLKFTHITHNDAGKKCFYLFDDNPEHLNKDFLADGNNPSSIAHFGDLKPGVYTVFSYHHRGTAAESEQDLFFDVLFRAENEASFKITKIGLDHDWQWNKVWADFSGTDVYLPEYLKTYNCTCKGKRCAKADGVCENGCGCVVRNELVAADSERFAGLNEEVIVKAEDNALLSEIIPTISENRINEIRHGGYNEPVWLMMELEIMSGEMSVDTVAYTNKEAASRNFDTMKRGRLAYEPQFKGIADSAPVVSAELSYAFDDETRAGALPVRIFNQKYPGGCVAKNGWFATNVNTWKDSSFIKEEAAESDMLQLTYRDEEKLSLYGNNVIEKNDVWHFSPFYTSLYSDSENDDFVPNVPMSQVDYPVGRERTSKKFYSKYVCNLGNFGVKYIYTVYLKNNAQTEKIFKYSMNSVSGQLYRFSLYSGGELVLDDGGRYIMKCFDMDPAEKKNGERVKPAKYTTTEEFVLAPNTEYTLDIEVVTLTGCDAPMTNRFCVE